VTLGPWRRLAALAATLAFASDHHASATRALEWRRAAPGLEWAESRTYDTRLVVVRIDPTRYRFHLAAGVSPGGTTPEWTVDRAPVAAALALNAGQFTGAAPWGWIVHEGIETRPPGIGPLSTAIIFTHEGRVRLVEAESLSAIRDSGIAEEAVQSYPTLLHGNAELPAALTEASSPIDLAHRDGRLALGVTAAGRVVIALTRYDLIVPGAMGPTVPEMAEIMRSLGCVRAVSLDGGLSSQMLIRDTNGTALTWRGWRAVPIGLFAMERDG
jgi:exopolysaccharide biosynthesis protein